MEKAVVFGPMIIFFGFFLLLIIAFLGFIVRLISKSKNEDWRGVVIDKKHNAVSDYDNPHKTNHFYYLVVKTEDGRERKLGLSQVLWDQFQVGDHLHKPKGKLFPDKI
jgi:hypothetical protein